MTRTAANLAMSAVDIPRPTIAPGFTMPGCTGRASLDR